MEVTVKALKMDMTNCYIVRQGDSIVLVDTGSYSLGAEKLLRFIKKEGRGTAKLKLIFLTHGHFDHIGAAMALAKKTGAKLALHRRDLDSLIGKGRVGANPLTRWAKLIMSFSWIMMTPGLSKDFLVAVPFGDEGLDLAEFGITGRIIHMPGHTPGSAIMILEDGRAFVGDCSMSGFPVLTRTPMLPIIGDDLDTLIKGWRLLLEGEKATRFFPGHGRAFNRDEALKMLPYADCAIGDGAYKE
jgi:hydroxyacylglutathione hydrolase